MNRGETPPVLARVKTTLSLTPILVRRTLLALGAALALGWLVNSAAASARWETLQAIHWVENPNDSPKPGRCGELGAYQFRAATWRMHTMRPFADAVTRAHSDEVAVRHYEWLRCGLERAGVAPTPYNIAMAWNAGLRAVVRGKVPNSTRYYAERVDNLAGELHARFSPAPTPKTPLPSLTPETTLAWAP